MIIENPNLESKYKEVHDKVLEYLKTNLSKSDEKKILNLILK